MLKTAKKCSASLLILTVMTTAIPSYAGVDIAMPSNECFSENVSIEQIDSNTYEVYAEDEKSTISIFDNDFERIVTIKNEDSNQDDVIRLDKVSGVVYSSITNETVNLNSTVNLSLIENDGISLLSSNKPPQNPMISYENKYISFSEIRRITGAVATAANVVGAFMVFIPGLTVGSAYVQSVATILHGLSGVIPDDSYRGFKLNVKKSKYYRYLGGKWSLRKIDYAVANVSRY